MTVTRAGSRGRESKILGKLDPNDDEGSPGRSASGHGSCPTSADRSAGLAEHLCPNGRRPTGLFQDRGRPCESRVGMPRSRNLVKTVVWSTFRCSPTRASDQPRL